MSDIARILCLSLLMGGFIIVSIIMDYRFGLRIKKMWEEMWEEREKNWEKKENEEKKQFIDKVNKKKEFYRKICSKNYDYIDARLFYKKRFNKSEDTEGLDMAERFEQRRVMVEMFAFRDVLEESFKDIGMELHLIKLSSLRNSEGIARILKYIMVVPKAYEQKEYCEGIQKLLKKELGLYAKVSDLKDGSWGDARWTQTIQQKSFRYKGYVLNIFKPEEVRLVSEIGMVKVFDNMSKCFHGIKGW